MVVGVFGVVELACTLEAAFMRITVSTAAEQALVCIAGRLLGLFLAKKTLRHRSCPLEDLSTLFKVLERKI